MTRRPKYRDQADTREQRVVSDQFGRPWLVTVEKESGDSCGPLMPCRAEPQWSGVPDDHVPPARYLRYDAQKSQVVIYWRWWREDLKTLLNPREREPQPITYVQLGRWRELLAYVEPRV